MKATCSKCGLSGMGRELQRRSMTEMKVMTIFQCLFTTKRRWNEGLITVSERKTIILNTRSLKNSFRLELDSMAQVITSKNSTDDLIENSDCEHAPWQACRLLPQAFCKRRRSSIRQQRCHPSRSFLHRSWQTWWRGLHLPLVERLLRRSRRSQHAGGPVLQPLLPRWCDWHGSPTLQRDHRV